VIDAGSLEYAHARLWARNGLRPDESAWHSLEVVRDFAALIETARRIPVFRDWTARIGPDADAHDVEAVLRATWRTLVAEVAQWMPLAWQPAVLWCAVLIDLPVVQYLSRGGHSLRWIDRDPIYRDLASGAPAALVVAGSLAPLSPFVDRPDELLNGWHAEWRRRLPRDSETQRSLVRLLRAHRRRLADAAIAEGTALRRELQRRLVILFRRALADPSAAFIFLALCALDLERLRGELLRRVAFPRVALAA
jgi:hypothetical protein